MNVSFNKVFKEQFPKFFFDFIASCPFYCRSAASFLRASKSIACLANPEITNNRKDILHNRTSELNSKDDVQTNQGNRPYFQFPFGDWFSPQWSKQKNQNESSSEWIKQNTRPNPFLPKITMVGISTGEAGQMSKASLKKTMEDLTKELEQIDQGNTAGTSSSNEEFKPEDRDPLFVANVGDYYSGMAKTGSARWVRRGNN